MSETKLTYFVTAFKDEDADGHVDTIIAERVEWSYNAAGERIGKRVIAPDIRILGDLVLLAIGFQGPDSSALGSSVALTSRGTLRTDGAIMTALPIGRRRSQHVPAPIGREPSPRVFAAGDAHMGQSIVVWAIGEGRDVARQIDLFLTGDSRLPPSLKTPNPLIAQPKRIGFF